MLRKDVLKGILDETKRKETSVSVEVTESLEGIDVFDPRVMPLISEKIGTDIGYVTDMVSVGKEIFAVYAEKVLLHSKDEGKTWHIALSIPLENDNLSFIFLDIDEAGSEGTPNGIYLFGQRHEPSDNGARAIVWYKAPNQDDWEMRDSGYHFSQGKLSVSGFSAGKLGMAFVTRQGWPIEKKTTVNFSTDGGLNWDSYQLPSDMAEDHTHDVWASPFEPIVYITTGDSYDGNAGVIKTTDFENWDHIYKEVPGYRIVPMWGSRRSRILGGEHASGAITLLTYDDKTFDVRFGRTGHEFANFRSLKESNDGLTVLGTYQYKALGDVVTGHAGTLHFSFDEGITYKRVRIPTDRISGIAITPNYVLAGGGYTHNNAEVWPYIVRVSRKYIEQVPYENQVLKPIHMRPNDANLTRCEIAPDSTTFSTNVRKYSNLKAYIRTLNAGELTFEGRLYEDDDTLGIGAGKWDTLLTRTYTGAKDEWVDLSEFDYYQVVRVRNTGGAAISVREISILGSLNSQ